MIGCFMHNEIPENETYYIVEGRYYIVQYTRVISTFIYKIRLISRRMSFE